MLLAPLLYITLAAQATTDPLDFRPPKPEEYWLVERWGLREGLPQTQVNAIEAAEDGGLWLGTLGGLAHFDGSGAHSLPPEEFPVLSAARIFALARTDDGVLFAATENDGLIALHDKTEHSLPLNRPWAKQPMRDLILAQDGTLWLLLANRLVNLRQSGEVIREWTDVPLSDSIEQGPLGRIWLAGDQVLRLEEDGFQVVLTSKFHSVFFQSNGDIWFGETDGHIVTMRNDEIIRDIRIDSRDRYDGYWCFVEDHEGAVWAGGQNPLRFTEDGVSLTLSILDAAPLVDIHSNDSYLDEEGNVWIGGGGLSCVRRTPLVAYRRDQFVGDTPRIVLFDAALQNRTTWVGLFTGTLLRLRGPQIVERLKILAESLASGPDGSTYAASARDGVFRLSDAAPQKVFSNAEFDTGRCAAFLIQDEAWWISSGSNLLCFKDGKLVQRWRPQDGLPGGEIQSIAIDAQQQVWVGTRQGLAVINQGQVAKSWQKGKHIGQGDVRDLFISATGCVWVGHYGAGLSVITPNHDVIRLSKREGLAENIVSRIMLDDHGNMVLLGNRGVSILDAEDLPLVEAGQLDDVEARIHDRCARLDQFEGMGGAMPAGCMLPDGRMLFPAFQAVVRFNPSTATKKLLPPRVSLTSLSTSAGPLDPDLNAEIPAESRDLSASFQAATFVDVHLVRFQYRLVGHDNVWVNAGPRTVAHYSRIPPGRYKLEVRAANRDGVWSQAAISGELHFRRTWTEHPGFRIGLALSLAAAVGFAYWLRLRVQLRTNERLRDEVQTATAKLAQSNQALETKLRRADRVDSIGRLASGVAHDFNNILTSVLGDIGLGRLETANPKVQRRFERIEISANKCAQLVARLLAAGRVQGAQAKTIDVDATLREQRAFLASYLEPNIQFELQLQAEGAQISIDPLHFERIFLNLIWNARDAIQGRGRVLVRTAIQNQEGAASQVVIHFRDTGPGVPEDLAAEIFEPFVTSKDGGAAMGLGLSSVAAYVLSANGSIDLVRDEQVGAYFVIRLPLANSQSDCDS